MKPLESPFHQSLAPFARSGFSRRQLLQLAAVAGSATLLSACSTNPGGAAGGAGGPDAVGREFRRA